MTKQFNAADTKKGFKEFNIKHVELVITDVPDYLNWFRERHSVFHHMYYILWQHWAWLWVKKSGIPFDVIHHVTMNDYRIPTEMYKQKEAKVIWGPVGGAQTTPRELKRYERNHLSAFFRECVNKSCSWNPIYRKRIRSYEAIYCINRETQEQLENITKSNIELIPELAIREEFKNIPIHRKENQILKLVFVGRIIEKKGLSFLIDALELLPTELQWKLLVFGDGKDRQNIEKQIRKSNIGEHIKLMGSRCLQQISEAYQQADIFVFPSLRETSGNVLLEAMAYAIPIIAFDKSFCTQLKKEKCGIFIDTAQPLERIKADWVKAIMDLGRSVKKREQLGKNGYNYVNQVLTWDKKYKKIYGTIIKE